MKPAIDEAITTKMVTTHEIQFGTFFTSNYARVSVANGPNPTVRLVRIHRHTEEGAYINHNTALELSEFFKKLAEALEY